MKAEYISTSSIHQFTNSDKIYYFMFIFLVLIKYLWHQKCLPVFFQKITKKLASSKAACFVNRRLELVKNDFPHLLAVTNYQAVSSIS